MKPLTDFGCHSPFFSCNSPYVNSPAAEHLTFSRSVPLPAHLTYWRYPNPSSYTPSPPGHPNALRLKPSRLNLTALNGNYAGDDQTFISRRQQHTLFSYSVTLDYAPGTIGEEAGVTAFLTQNHHLDMGVVLLPRGSATAPSLPGLGSNDPDADDSQGEGEDDDKLIPHVRFRGESYVPVPAPAVYPLPRAWRSEKLVLEIRASNTTHFTFSIGPEGRRSQRKLVMEASNDAVSWGFTGESFFFFSPFLSPSLFFYPLSFDERGAMWIRKS